MAKRRPFFSIVVPCYNDGRYAPGQYVDRVLTSICNQGLKKSDIEVIISDDHSHLPYDLTLKQYEDKLNIKYVQTDYNFGPGNTRQKGADVATGKWLCFIDHDDMFTDNALSCVKQAIQSTNEQYVVYTDFDKVDVDNKMEVVEDFRGDDLKAFVHGKFYNIDNFWIPCKLHFIKDLKTHEDIALSKLVECALVNLNTVPLYLTKVCYIWTYNKTSISHSVYYPEGSSPFVFLYNHFDDYLTATIRTVLEAYDEGLIKGSEALSSILPSLMMSWVHMCNFKSSNISQYLQVNDAYCSKILQEIKTTFNMPLPAIKVVCTKMFSDHMNKVNATASDNGIYITFLDWLTDINNLDYIQIIEDFRNVNAETHSDNVADSAEHRPFFSCIIACYNDGRYKDGVYLDRLLDSLVRQGIDKQDLEVILSDDCSPEPFIDRIYSKYGDKLLLKYIETDYNFAPGNTRAKGLTIATGEWLCFADHDDIYYDDALAQVKKSIADKNEKHFLFGDFNGVNPEGEVVRKYEGQLNWCHAKFYNKDNFWDKYGIHFIKDLKSHEDIAICTQVSCALSAYVPNYTYVAKPLYAWTDNPQSVSHAKYTVDTETGPREFLEVFYDDYLHSTGYVYLEQFGRHNIKITYAIKGVLEIMCYAYFYQQGFCFRRPDDYYKGNLDAAGRFIDECKKTFNLTNESIYKAVSSNHAVMYYNVLKQANMGSGKYIPTHTFKQWLNIVSPDS